MTNTSQIGTPQRYKDGWHVPSGQVVYFMSITPERARCTCPSFVWKRKRLPRSECKHIAKVREVMRHG
jgi:hypothetical protein